jgi:hypothetical protein
VEKATSILPRLEVLTLSVPQTGRKSFLLGQICWAREEYDAAFNYYLQASENLPRDFSLSEAYSRMADYYSMKDDNEKALFYAEKGLQITPDFVWRIIQVGNIKFYLEQYEEALELFHRAEKDGSLDQRDVYYQGLMATAYLELGDRKKFDTYARRNIDAEMARMEAKGALTNEDKERLHILKKSFTDMSKEYGGSIYAFGTSYQNDDYMAGFTAEVKKNASLFGYRTELYGKLGGTLVSAFSGTYYDPWSDSDKTWSGESDINDSLHAAVGGRIYPFDSSPLFFALEQVFAIGSAAEDDTLLIANFYEAIGNDWEPIESHWNYASIYSQVVFSTKKNDLTYGGDLRGGA